MFEICFDRCNKVRNWRIGSNDNLDQQAVKVRILLVECV